MKSKIILLFFLILTTILVAGCTERLLQEVSEPNIQLSSWDHEESFNFNKGAYSDVTYTLYNSGDADGLVDVVILGDNGKVISRNTEYVTAHGRITSTTRADTSITDDIIKIRLENQRKAN